MTTPLFGESPHHGPLVDPVLRVLVLQRGREVERSARGAIRWYGGAFFHLDARDDGVSGPYPDLPTLFRAHGTVLLDGAGGQVLEWDGWVVSRDADGWVSGPHQGFDEWVWMEAEPVQHERGPTGSCFGLGGRYVHHWRGFYFVTVDPLPACSAWFTSLDRALSSLRSLAFLDSGLHEG